MQLKNVRKQNEEICKLAVKQNAVALKYVEYQTEEICWIEIS